MRTFARIWGAVAPSPGTGSGIVSSGGVPILPSGTPAGQQPPIGTPVPVWVVIETDASGNNDMIYLVTLAQCLLLGLAEDPVYSWAGIPALQSVQTGIPPTYYMNRTQKYFSQFFASLVVQQVRNSDGDPVYNITAMTHQGVVLNASVPLPT